jgi:co-chaperonin GroES (HSP10)
MKKICAVYDKVIVETLKEIESISTGGIVIPSSVITLPQSYGKIISIGPDSVGKGLNEGEILIYHKHAGQVMLVDNIEYRILLPAEIYGTYLDV